MKTFLRCIALTLLLCGWLAAQDDSVHTSYGGFRRIQWQFPFDPPVSVGSPGNINLPAGDGHFHMFNITNDNHSYEMARFDTYGVAPNIGGQNDFHFVRAGGTQANPTSTTNGMYFISMGCRGFVGSAEQLSSCGYDAIASENWDGGGTGIEFHWEVTKNRTLVRNGFFDMYHNGNFGLSGVIQNSLGVDGNGVPIVPTATMGITLKKGTGGGDYSHSGDTNFTDVDASNLALTVLIPTGWKLGVTANCEMSVSTATANVQLALFDSVANTQVVIESVSPSAVSTPQANGLSWVVTGDGNTHTVKLQFKTGASADAVVISNGSRIPTMVLTLMPSN